uniref:Uncharacterized protein n=1 Tax=mine drainage metagenome TaxID=410659 RepID=E6QJY1_9ZZZZ
MALGTGFRVGRGWNGYISAGSIVADRAIIARKGARSFSGDTLSVVTTEGEDMDGACVVISKLDIWWLGDGDAGFFPCSCPCPCPPMPHRTRHGWGTLSGYWGGKGKDVGLVRWLLLDSERPTSQKRDVGHPEWWLGLERQRRWMGHPPLVFFIPLTSVE